MSLDEEYRQLTLFRTAVPFWGQTTLISSSLFLKRDCGSKGVTYHLYGDLLRGAILNRTYRTYKTYTFHLFYQQYLVLFTVPPPYSRSKRGLTVVYSIISIFEQSTVRMAIIK